MTFFYEVIVKCIYCESVSIKKYDSVISFSHKNTLRFFFGICKVCLNNNCLKILHFKKINIKVKQASSKIKVRCQCKALMNKSRCEFEKNTIWYFHCPKCQIRITFEVPLE